MADTERNCADDSIAFLEHSAIVSSEVTDVLDRRVQVLERRQCKLEERLLQDRFSLDGPTPVQWVAVQAELERLRRLFEFVENVLPKNASDAMKFFNRSRSPGRSPTSAGDKSIIVASLEAAKARPLGPDVEIERHKAQLEDMVRKLQAEVHDEVQNCMLAIKGVERLAESTKQLIQTGPSATGTRPRSSGANGRRRVDVQVPNVMAVSGIAEATKAETHDGCHSTSDAQSGPARQLCHSTSDAQSGPARQLVADSSAGLGDKPSLTIQKVQHDLEVTREEVKSWLDAFYTQISHALQMKADKAASQADEGLSAALSRRALLGCCASCGAVARGPPGSQWRPRSSPGAHQLRTPSGKLPKFDVPSVKVSTGRAKPPGVGNPLASAKAMSSPNLGS